MPIITNILITITITALAFLGIYNYVPTDILDMSDSLGGTVSLNTITGSTKLSDYPALANANWVSLNTHKLSISALSATTTLPNLVSVGTITTGTWSATAIGVAKGGTGTTSPTQYLVMLGNGSSGLSTVNGTGASGQFLTSGGAAAVPTWTTSSIDLTANYNWTGIHSFGNATGTPSTNHPLWVLGNLGVSGTTTSGALVATSTIGFGDVGYSVPLADGSIFQHLTTDGNTGLSWGYGAKLEGIGPEALMGRATTTAVYAFSTNTTAEYTMFNAIAPFDVTDITITVETVGSAGVLNLAIYSLRDGVVTKEIDVATASISAPGRVTTSTTTTSLPAGTYYFGVGSSGSANVSLLTLTLNNTIWGESDSYGFGMGISGQPAWSSGTTGGEASVLPDTFDETASGGIRAQILFRIDN